MFNEKVVLITGGTGTVGKEIVRQLIENYDPKEVRVFSRNEVSQVEMRKLYPDCRYVIGDIRDIQALKMASHGVNYIFHEAAIKHVPLCENQPDEAVKTNILGISNLILAAGVNGVTRVVNMSSDKAVHPNNFYGLTKAIGERLINQANDLPYQTEFLNIRSGNVFGSSGSVIPLFIEQASQYNKVVLTDKKMTRYFTSIQSVVSLLINVMRSGTPRKIYIPADRISFSLGDIANVIAHKYGNSETIISEIGARPGEKIHEKMFSETEFVYCLTTDGERKVYGDESSADCVRPLGEITGMLENIK